MAEDLDDATLSLVAHNLRGQIGVAVGATRTVRRRWEELDGERRDELLAMAERGMLRVRRRTVRDHPGPAGRVHPRPATERQWQAAASGVERGEVPREESMCAPAVVHRQTVSVADPSLDPRFAANPFVAGPLGRIRLYAAVPLIAPVQHVVGTLCVFDEQPGELTDRQVAALEDLARVVTPLFEQRALAAELREAATWQHELIADLDRECRRNEHLLDRLDRREA